MSDPTCMERLLVEIVIFSGISSAGLLVAALCVWAVLAVHARRKGRSSQKFPRMSWSFKLVTILLFVAEQLPESLVLAFSFVSGFVDISLAVFLLAVQFCSFSGTLLDHMPSKPPKQLYTVWSRLFSFALGTLVANFASILDHFEIQTQSAAEVGMLVLGLALGVALFSLISLGESKTEPNHHRPDHLPSLRRLLTISRERLYSIQTEQGDHHKQARRVDSLRNLVSSLEHAQGLKRELSE